MYATIRNLPLVVVLCASSLFCFAGKKEVAKHLAVGDSQVLSEMRYLFETNSPQTVASEFLKALKPGTEMKREGALLTPTEYFAMPLPKRPMALHPHTVSLLVFAVDQALYGSEGRQPKGHCRAYAWPVMAENRLPDDPFKKQPLYMMGFITGTAKDWDGRNGMGHQMACISAFAGTLWRIPQGGALSTYRSYDLTDKVDNWGFAERILEELLELRRSPTK